MSVIPLIVEGPNQTVVERAEEFESNGGLEGNVVMIQELDRGQLDSENNSNVSYDLRVGREYRDHRDVGKKELPENGEITLLPGAAVIVETRELVRFPKSMFGQIVPKVSLLQTGLSNTSSKVDPGYSGQLLITIFNLGKKTVRLHRDEQFCSLYVLQVLDGARPYDKPAKRIEGQSKRSPWHRIRDILEMNSALISVLVLIATLALFISKLL